ncbi:hypothetical protein SAMN04487905_10919 [Actinopolyspora xinjiangensis]|uniref:Uncharacterized protein n=1 Tax=Actinopolyspora xinjiangensis TaxID=405564 RepID=A0A1H0VJK8_9ACTN|nr:hypothetical protein [Actinopolyspora xinjiangensis]SDP78533.1 hypothetical protein SAMN04487905_10919 [Actinopolyspora xinjiangensis]
MEAIFADYPDIIPAPVRTALNTHPENKVFDTVVEGRGSYEVGLRANAYPHLRHYVFSRTITQTPDPSVEIVSTDPVETVRELKREDGKKIWLCGGGRLTPPCVRKSTN